MAVGAIILAAGGSARMGEPKQLINVGGEALVRRVARRVCDSRADPVLVVLGANADAVAPAIAGLPVIEVRNERWKEGQGCSLAFGVESLCARFPSCEAVVVISCDQVNLNAEIIDNLIHMHHLTGKGIVASRYAVVIGVPTLFSQRYFADLRALKGDRGARLVFDSAPGDIEAVPFPGGDVDFDTCGDVRRWRGEDQPASGGVE